MHRKATNKALGSLLFLLLVMFCQVVNAQDKADRLQEILSKKSDSWVYIVQMDLDPAISYKGELTGFKATKPDKGKKFNPRSPKVKKYREYLEDKHDEALKASGVDKKKKIYDYNVAINGFAAQLTKAQALQLAKQPGVAKVKRDQFRYKTTDNSPIFLGLTASGGPWDTGVTGEGVVVGVIDTGIWPEHPSFADDGSYGPSPVPALDNTRPNCDFGNIAHNADDAPFSCNNKLLGARQMLDTYRSLVGADADEFDSARDDEGHGTHTASTSAGNAGVSAAIFGIPRGKVSGVAPRARVIAYKGLGKLGGFSSDLAAAIDQAVADGVDVINYSLGGGPSLDGADDIAFLFAADAGVFVATSAGNDGPDPATIGGPASVPWLTSVGASSQSRAFISEIAVEGPANPPSHLWGGSITQGIEHFNLVDADTVVAGSNGECLDPFPAGTFSATDVVLCNRYIFGTARSDRVANVAAGGGGAVIFINVSALHPNMMPTDNHPLPTVHLLKDVGQPLKDYLVAHPGKVKLSFNVSEARYSDGDPRVLPNYMASFSSRGPDPVAPDIIKPDVTAPGINILAGASPIHADSAAQGELFQSIMGTSMSGPHVAGIFALIKQAHPDWSPAMAKSALMTSAYQDVVKPDYVTPADPFDMGAGHVNPGGRTNRSSMFNPGLVYDAGFLDYLGFMCDAEPSVFADPVATCGSLEGIGIPTKAYNLNLASIGVAALTGKQTVVRTVTSVSNRPGYETYRVSVDAPPGFAVSVTPTKLKLKQGESASYSVSFSNETAPIGEWRFGSLSWRSGSPASGVRSPIAVRAALFNAATQVNGSGETSIANFDVKFGYSGNYQAVSHGLEPASVTVDSVLQDPDQTFDPNDGYSKVYSFNLTAANAFRIAMPPDAVADPNVDIDIYVFDPLGNMVASSTNAGTDELIDIKQPMDGSWHVYVQGWQTVAASADFTLYSWVISSLPGSNLVVDSAPASATLGTLDSVQVSWSGATLGQWYLGAVSHHRDADVIGLTLINIDNR